MPDLPGFGKSDKPLDVSYSFDYQAPFARPECRAALLKTINDIKIDDLGDIAKKLPELGIPISIIYGEKDIWLASEM